MGHIELSRDADLVVVAPATADLIAKHGGRPRQRPRHAPLLLATDKPVLLAPGDERARCGSTRRPGATSRPLTRDGVLVVGPDDGEMACGEFGPGRMAEPRRDRRRDRAPLLGDGAAARRPARPRHLGPDPRADRPGALHRQPLLRQAGPRHRRGARRGSAPRVTFVTGPVAVADPPGVRHRPGRDRPPRCSPPSRRRCRPTSRSAPPPSPTGASTRPPAPRSRRTRAPAAAARARREPRHPARPSRRAGTAAPAPRRRLRRRDRRRRRQRHRQARRARAATGSSPTTCRRAPASWGRPKHRPPGHRGGRRDVAGADQGRGRRRIADRIAAALAG